MVAVTVFVAVLMTLTPADVFELFLEFIWKLGENLNRRWSVRTREPIQSDERKSHDLRPPRRPDILEQSRSKAAPHLVTIGQTSRICLEPNQE